ncbi:MAG: helix-turn-helix domain-containing protein [Myxococcota bacterium]
MASIHQDAAVKVTRPSCRNGSNAGRTASTTRTLRYYEERGLIVSVGRRGLQRLFEPRVLEQLALIALGQQAGFSLDEIAGMFGPDGEPQLDRQVLAAKADELDAAIGRLTALRDGLRHAAACSAPSHRECPTFRGLLREATGRPRPRRRVPR